VSRIDERGVVMLFGERQTPTRLDWDCLEGVVSFLAGGSWVAIGSVYDTRGREGTLDGYLKRCVKRATAAWVAALLERAGVVDVARTRPAQVRLAGGFEAKLD
jgi:hypothetical protein